MKEFMSVVGIAFAIFEIVTNAIIIKILLTEDKRK